ncbi:uncharacterized protein RSE6_11685 [Rhynchosporium secalis]|uniref:Uncharacterized protein n=1 Tax=Rhynchosporium secalis TaxID=38038 RepID=A0A1E1MNI6_RHYSE|nr:uncharacterized protein RSE6_11685 [Rhynchosporium secalis]
MSSSRYEPVDASVKQYSDDFRNAVQTATQEWSDSTPHNLSLYPAFKSTDTVRNRRSLSAWRNFLLDHERVKGVGMNTGVADKDAREVIWGWASTSQVSTRWHYFRPSQEGTALSRAQHASRGKTIQKEGSQAEPNGRPATDEEEKGLIRRRWNKRTGHAILNDEGFEARSGGAARSWDGKFCLLLHVS